MGKKPPKWLPGERVDETILMQRKSVEQLRADRMLGRKSDAAAERRERMRRKLELKQAKKLSTRRFISAQAILHTAEKRVKNAREFNKAGERFDTRRVMRAPEQVREVYRGARVALVIRAKGKMLPAEVKAGFDELKLSKLYTARLILLTPEAHKLLLQLKRFAAVGYPTRDQLEQLLRSRGAIWNTSTAAGTFRTHLTGNLIVEQAFAKEHDVYTIEELADAVFSKARKVQALLARIAPFDLHPPRLMFFERNRSVHEKLEVLNAESFAALLASTLDATPKPKLTQAAKKKAAAPAAAAAAAASARAKPAAAVSKDAAPAATTAAAAAVAAPAKPAAAKSKAPAPKVAPKQAGTRRQRE